MTLPCGSNMISTPLWRSPFVTHVIVLLTICAASSCGGSAAAPKASASMGGVQYASITIGSLKRTYRLFIPPSLDPKQSPPLVVALVGCPKTGEEMAQATNLDGRAENGGFDIVYPDPIAGCWNAGTQACVLNPNADDITFIGRLLDRLTTDLRVDRARVFAAGFDCGAVMAYRLACELSDRIAAIASVGGEMDDSTNCRPSTGVSILEMHGTDDSWVDYTQGAKAVQQWVTFDGCVGNPTLSNSSITKTSLWSNCHQGTSVRFDTVVGGHHTWFGSYLGIGGPVVGEPKANAVVWDFFSSLTPRS
jgi:polyhydroxybutyrate depolymerase